MLVSFTEDELIKIGRGMAQKQEGIIALFEYLERAMPAAAMHAVNTSGEQSEKFKGYALCMEKIITELSDSAKRAKDLIEKNAIGNKGGGHILIT